MMYFRGSTKDYDEWADLGNPGWSWKDILPYFKKSERLHGVETSGAGTVDADFHGTDGRVGVSVPQTHENWTRGFDVVDDAAMEMGYKKGDYNGLAQVGRSLKDYDP